MKRKPEAYTKSGSWLFLGLVLGILNLIHPKPSGLLVVLVCLGVAAILEKLEEK